VKGKSVSLVINAGGTGMRLSYPVEGEDDLVVLEGSFSGVASPEECSWVIDEDEAGQRCICLSLRKRRRHSMESTWWARFMQEEELADTALPPPSTPPPTQPQP
jgi:hypothetical protein